MILHLSKAVVVFSMFVAGVALAACGDASGAETSGKGIKVVTTTTQIGALTREVAGDEVELTVLLGAGADAHDYEPNPQAVRKIGDAALVLRNGIGLDDWLDRTLEAAGGSKKIVTVTDGVAIRRDGNGAEDPHVWHNPENAKRMVDNIVAALSGADAKNEATFEANGEAYKAKLDATDAEIRALIEELPEANRKMVTNHDAFGYFIDYYGLTFVGAVIPGSNRDSQPSAKELAELQDLIEREGVKVIFSEEEVDPKVARELADDAGVTIVEGLYADSLGETGSGAETIDGMLLFNARKIVEALE